jgi:hypothetical protein
MGRPSLWDLARTTNIHLSIGVAPDQINSTTQNRPLELLIRSTKLAFKVTEVVVSLAVSDQNYGNGGKNFISLRAEDLEGDIHLVTHQLFHKAYLAIQTARFEQGEINGADLNKILTTAEQRYNKIVAFLQPEISDE